MARCRCPHCENGFVVPVPGGFPNRECSHCRATFSSGRFSLSPGPSQGVKAEHGSSSGVRHNDPKLRDIQDNLRLVNEQLVRCQSMLRRLMENDREA